MATIILDDQRKEVSDGSPVKDACREMGVPFGCETGNCGTCTVNVVNGMDNLSPVSEKESDYGLESSERLMCQCNILQGEVEISL